MPQTLGQGAEAQGEALKVVPSYQEREYRVMDRCLEAWMMNLSFFGGDESFLV